MVVAECARCHAGPVLERVGPLDVFEYELFLCGSCAEDSQTLGLSIDGEDFATSGCRRPGCRWHAAA